MDSDEQYETYREDWGMRLDEYGQSLFKEFIDIDRGYYKDDIKKLINHLHITLESLQHLKNKKVIEAI